MCGIAGQVGGRIEEATLIAMGNRIAHRGPDGSGVWIEDNGLAGLAHRRLAIVDLSESGRQPMASKSNRYVISFNGEIYNYRDLRDRLELDGKAPEGGWRGHSDTEVLLALIDAYGWEESLVLITGMFAIALWDAATQELYLARDRFGEKPLYYGWSGDAFLFASDLAAIKAHPSFNAALNSDAVAALLQRNYIPAPLSIYKDYWKLPPASYLVVKPSRAQELRSSLSRPQAHSGENSPIKRYWLLEERVIAGAEAPFSDETEALEALDGAFSQALRRQNQADVPVGAFLSGGVDSSSIVALLSHHTTSPVRTFTIGFAEREYDESNDARRVAALLGTEHQELIVDPSEAMSVIASLPEIYSEPFADSSQIPTLLVSKMAREHVTVALSGDGGDELFGGYNRYLWTRNVWSRLKYVPAPLRRIIGQGLLVPSPSFWQLVARAPGRRRASLLEVKAQKVGRILRHAATSDAVYSELLNEWPVESLPVAHPSDFALVPDIRDTAGTLAVDQRMMALDAMTYLPDDILCKVDRASMAVSLETRAPMLDHHLAEVAFRLPVSMRIRGNTTKWALRELLYRHVPREIIDRPKTGFGIPVSQWLRGPLREWAEDLLSEQALRSNPFLDALPIRKRWLSHLSGRDHMSSLWSILMLQAFCRQA